MVDWPPCQTAFPKTSYSAPQRRWIATSNDEKRIAFMNAALNEVQACIADGIDVRSYLHWSLLDDFEWTFGYAPTFGMVAVDRETFAREPKPSAAWLGAVAQARRLP